LEGERLVKQGILLGISAWGTHEDGDATFSFVDKDTFPARQFAVADRVRGGKEPTSRLR
jgi:hypothetical protein